MAISKIEMTIGKLRTAIRMLLLLAFAAMPEIRLSDPANPHEQRRSVEKKSRWSWTGSSINTENNTKPTTLSRRQSIVL
jgi:hypothetical protein